MKYNEIRPCDKLQGCVKCYYIYESESDTTFEDIVYPSGCIEIIFNLGVGKWQTAAGDRFTDNPSIELWGQITKPLAVKSVGCNTMLGIRFLPHAAAYFLSDKIGVFNNQVVDFADVSGGVTGLHSRLMETPQWNKRIELIEQFLMHMLSVSQNRLGKLNVVSNIMQEMRQENFFDNIDDVASRYGITARYLQKLFLQYTGLSPKLYSKINRFQNSLRLVTQKGASLTSIAYDCGYFDQSHFIREFKSFTGFTPSGVPLESSSITLAFAK